MQDAGRLFGSRPAETPLRFWSPVEVAVFYGLMVGAFGLILGDGKFAFAMELFAPVLGIGVIGLVIQFLMPLLRAVFRGIEIWRLVVRGAERARTSVPRPA